MCNIQCVLFAKRMRVKVIFLTLSLIPCAILPDHIVHFSIRKIWPWRVIHVHVYTRYVNIDSSNTMCLFQAITRLQLWRTGTYVQRIFTTCYIYYKTYVRKKYILNSILDPKCYPVFTSEKMYQLFQCSNYRIWLYWTYYAWAEHLNTNETL
jgi:hypothetical protein